MDQNSAGFMYLKNRFIRISDAKTKEGVFVGSQIRYLMQDTKFEDSYVKWNKQHENHSTTSLPFFPLGNKAENCRDTVVDLVQAYKIIGCNVFKGAFLRPSLRLLPRKSRGSE
jgi:hypothetical protein